MNVLSVDLGTSNTVAVLAAHGRQPRVVDIDGASMMPSAVFADDSQLVVGREAERRARMDPSRFEPNPKRRIDDGELLLGDVVLPVADALAAVLRRVAVETSRQLGGAAPDHVRLTHPAQWGPVRRDILLTAARQAGLGRNVLLVPEPVAAAAHYASFAGHTIAPGEAIAVYDLGAGTFDIAVVGASQTGFVVLAEAGLPDLGGLDVDQALLDHVGGQVSRRDPEGWQRLLVPRSTSDRRAARALRQDVTAAKESLSEHPQTEVPLPDPFGDVLVTRQELDDLIRPNLTRSVELLAGTIKAANLTPDRLTGIYLVGGSSRIPLVAALITSGTGVVPSSLDQPETAVALGAHHMNPDNVGPSTNGLPPVDQEQHAPAIPPRPILQAPREASHPVAAQPPRSQPQYPAAPTYQRQHHSAPAAQQFSAPQPPQQFAAQQAPAQQFSPPQHSPQRQPVAAQQRSPLDERRPQRQPERQYEEPPAVRRPPAQPKHPTAPGERLATMRPIPAEEPRRSIPAERPVSSERQVLPKPSQTRSEPPRREPALDRAPRSPAAPDRDHDRRMAWLAAGSLSLAAACVLVVFAASKDILVQLRPDEIAYPTCLGAFSLLMIFLAVRISRGRGGHVLGSIGGFILGLSPFGGYFFSKIGGADILVRHFEYAIYGVVAFGLLACVLCLWPSARRGAMANR